MAYRMKGTYITNCNCRLMCPCPWDGPPTGQGDQCTGVVVFHLDEGGVGDVDLSGVNFAWYNLFPSTFHRPSSCLRHTEMKCPCSTV